jgi:phosphatidylserine decarboxylase
VGEFVREFGLDAGEFERGVGEFVSFDDFFSRKLRPGARLVEGGGDVAVFPADGRHLGFEDVSRVGGIYAKGQVFDLGALLGDGELAERYRRGAVVCSRLCPVDYHRFHFPVGGRPAGRRLLNGWLYSVSPVALRRNVAWLWENKRCCVSVDAGAWGVVTVVVIGATNVGSMTFTFREGEVVEKGAEMGFFGFGGSFMVTLFEPGRIALAGDLVRESAAGRELYVRMGGELGRLACAG